MGGSKKHGGPDLGPTRPKCACTSLGVDGMGTANEPPERKQIRRAMGGDQVEVLKWLVKKFPKQAKELLDGG